MRWAYEKTNADENKLFNRIFNQYESWRKTVGLLCRVFRFINIFTNGKFEWNWNKSEPDTHCACKVPKKFLSRNKEFIHKNGAPIKWCFDYCKECKMSRRPSNHFIAFEEFRRAKLFFFRMTQCKYFYEDLKILKKPNKTFEDLPQK